MSVCQQDGARPHTGKDNVAKMNAYSITNMPAGGLPIEMVTQPANSYDTNVNDLAFFSANAKLFNRRQKLCSVDDMDALLRNAQDAYWGFDPYKLERIWKMKTKVLGCIMMVNGGV